MSEVSENPNEQQHTPEFYVEGEVLFLFSSQEEIGDSINVLNDIFLPSPLVEDPNFQEWISRLESETRPVFHLSPGEGGLPKFVASARLSRGTVGEFVQEYVDIFLPSSADEAAPVPRSFGVYSLNTLTANWYSGGSQHIGTGGPDGDPTVASYSDPNFKEFRFKFRNNVLTAADFFALAQGATAREIDVAILDTVPTIGDIQAAVSKLSNRNHPLKSLLTDNNGQVVTLFSSAPNRRAGKLTITYEGDLPTPVELVNIPSLHLPYPNDCAPTTGHDHPIANHGLFIAGIIHLIAPDANIHLIQALNDYAVGSLLSILNALDYAKSQKRNNVPLIINASFTIDFPVDPNSCKNPQDPLIAAIDNKFNFQAEQKQLFEDIFTVSSGNERIIVAAGGNDSARTDNTPVKLVARYPAAAADVWGVGALDDQDNPAPYSNMSDTPPVLGIVTFGGTENKGMLGIYVGNSPTNTPNPDFCARWSGTSFATAIVTGTMALKARSHLADLTNNLGLSDVKDEISRVPSLHADSENGLLVTQGL